MKLEERLWAITQHAGNALTSFRRFRDEKPLAFNLAVSVTVSMLTIIVSAAVLDQCTSRNNDGFDFAALADARARSILDEHIRSRDAAIARSDDRIREQERLVEQLRERHELLLQDLERARERDRKHEADIANLKKARDKKSQQIESMDIRGLSDELERLGY
jgi:TolA-binding protein